MQINPDFVFLFVVDKSHLFLDFLRSQEHKARVISQYPICILQSLLCLSYTNLIDIQYRHQMLSFSGYSSSECNAMNNTNYDFFWKGKQSYEYISLTAPISLLSRPMPKATVATTFHQNIQVNHPRI